MVVLLRCAVEDAAVSSLADLPVHLELEVVELLLRHDVVHRRALRERAVHDAPAGRYVGLLIASEGVEVAAVEEDAPGAGANHRSGRGSEAAARRRGRALRGVSRARARQRDGNGGCLT